MRIIFLILTVFCLVFAILQIIHYVFGEIQYENEIGYAWELADKSSTMDEKLIYIKEFVNNLNDSKHNQYGDIIKKTKNTSWDYNLTALKSLQNRLEQIKEMDITSLEYQMAIQQITQQEQGEAGAMLEIFMTAWKIENGYYFSIWIFMLIFQFIFWIGFSLFGMIIIVCD